MGAPDKEDAAQCGDAQPNDQRAQRILRAEPRPAEASEQAERADEAMGVAEAPAIALRQRQHASREATKRQR